MLDCKEEIPQRPLSLSNQGFQKSNQEQPKRLASRSSDECEWKSSAVGLAQLSPSPAWSTQNGDALKYGGDASLLLIGVRGAGKTSLAIMASSVMSRKVINIDHAFHATLGLSPQQYKATHGLAECQEQQLRLLRAVFGRYHSGYILICTWSDHYVQPLFREFAEAHPVIHVVRDPGALEKLYNVADKSKVRAMLRGSRSIWRASTNFEFFNLCEKQARSNSFSPPTIAQHGRPSPPSLALKEAERHFLRFLSRIYPARTFPRLEEPACPLANIPIEDRKFTYALSLPLNDVIQESFHFESLIVGSDAIEIIVHDPVDNPQDDLKTNPSLHDSAMQLLDDITKAVAKARRCTSLLIILHVIHCDAKNSEADLRYRQILRHCLRLAPDMMTIDLRLPDDSILDILASRQRTRAIGHYYDLEESSNWDSPIWLSMYLKADSLGCHFVRLIRPATSSEENRQVSNFRAQISQLEDAKAILIAYNSGTLGRTSAIFNDVLTETRPSTPNSTMITSPGSSQAPSITALEATTALFSSFARDTLNFYVFGRDVDYSLSPAMMTSALRACGLPHQYRPWSTPTLQDIRHLTEDPLFGGGTVSYPLKVEALDLAHSISKHAQAIGAVNTLIPIRCLEKDGSVPTGARFFKQITQSGPVQALHGENTDWIGIGACVLRGLSPANAVTPSSSCLILGAGGMGRAAIYSMLRLGVRNIVVYNRTRSNAERVVSHFTKLVRDSESQKDGDISSTRFSILTNIDEAWPDDFRLPSIIISCIPIEAYEEPSSPPFVIPKDYLANKTGGVALEIAYKTLDTPLIVQAKKEAARGWVVMDGLDILPEQGFAQFELFTVRRAPQHVMRSEIRLRSSHS